MTRSGPGRAERLDRLERELRELEVELAENAEHESALALHLADVGAAVASVVERRTRPRQRGDDR